MDGTRGRWRARLVTVIASVVAVAGMPALATPAAAATPGCTVATATPIDLGVVNPHTTTAAMCSGKNSTYNYVDLAAGDVLTVDIDARGLVSSSLDLYLYNPGVDDFTVGTASTVGSIGVYRSQMSQGSWRAYEPGRFILRWSYGAGVVFTPSVTAVAPQAGRVTGACRIESAPAIPSGVTQYVDSSPCNGSRFWRIDLAVGQKLSLALQAYSGTDLYVYPPTVTDYTLSQSTAWCRASSYGATTADCGAALQAGSYVLRASGKASFTPSVTTPAPPVTTPTVKYPTTRIWTYSKGGKLEVDVDPNAGFEWKVRLQKLKNNVWVNASKKKSTKKTHRKFNPKKGTYRVVVYAKKGYSTTASASVVILK